MNSQLTRSKYNVNSFTIDFCAPIANVRARPLRINSIRPLSDWVIWWQQLNSGTDADGVPDCNTTWYPHRTHRINSNCHFASFRRPKEVQPDACALFSFHYYSFFVAFRFTLDAIIYLLWTLHTLSPVLINSHTHTHTQHQAPSLNSQPVSHTTNSIYSISYAFRSIYCCCSFTQIDFIVSIASCARARKKIVVVDSVCLCLRHFCLNIFFRTLHAAYPMRESSTRLTQNRLS